MIKVSSVFCIELELTNYKSSCSSDNIGLVCKVIVIGPGVVFGEVDEYNLYTNLSEVFKVAATVGEDVVIVVDINVVPDILKGVAVLDPLARLVQCIVFEQIKHLFPEYVEQQAIRLG